jgi:ABC-type transport system involved in Fe-S cluster assembly fused permease/ATPase subunit
MHLEDFNFTMMATAVANLIADQLSDEELDIAVAFVSQLSQTLAAVALLRDIRQNKTDQGKGAELSTENNSDSPFLPFPNNPILP